MKSYFFDLLFAKLSRSPLKIFLIFTQVNYTITSLQITLLTEMNEETTILRHQLLLIRKPRAQGAINLSDI